MTATSADEPFVLPATLRGRAAVAGHVGMLAAIVVLFGSVVDILPENPIFWLVTPLRLVLLVGIAAVVVVRPSWRAFTTSLDLPLLALLGASGLSSMLAGEGLSQWRWLATLVATYYLAVGLCRTVPAAALTLRLTALLAVAVTSLVALGQAAQQTPTGFCRSGFVNMACTQHGALVRVSGTFTNPNLLAAFLVLFLPMVVVAAWTAREEYVRLVFVVIAVGAVAALALTFSRAGVIGLLVSVLVMISTMTRSRWRPGPRVVAASGAALALMVGLALAAGIGVRREVWTAAISAASHHPLGVGLGRAGVVISANVPGPTAFAHAHNLWLNWYLEAGLVGLTAVVFITVYVALRLRAAVRTGDRTSLAVASGLAGFTMVCLVDDPMNTTTLAVPMMIVLGLAATAPLGRRTAGKRVAPRRSAGSRTSASAEAEAKVEAQLPVKPETSTSGELPQASAAAEVAPEPSPQVTPSPGIPAGPEADTLRLQGLGGVRPHPVRGVPVPASRSARSTHGQPRPYGGINGHRRKHR
ncbi:MAG: O-antigen ligase family protein [Nocardioides sp.]|nr:O-antigen ligase family protein [Nocardioides sp.]